MSTVAAPLRWLCATSILLVVLAGCGGSETAVPQGPVSARVVVMDVQVSADGERVEYITVRIDDDKELAMRLGDNIDPTIWGAFPPLEPCRLRQVSWSEDWSHLRPDS